MKPAHRAVFALVLAVPAVAISAEPEPRVELRCRREPSPGRVVCDLDIETEHARLAWADAIVQSAPDFVRPLRSRVGVRESSSKSDRRLELPLAFVATKTGKGEVLVLARAVVCTTAEGSSQELCVPETRRVRALIEVGITESAPR
jgi:hypothetical protein